MYSSIQPSKSFSINGVPSKLDKFNTALNEVLKDERKRSSFLLKAEKPSYPEAMNAEEQFVSNHLKYNPFNNADQNKVVCSFRFSSGTCSVRVRFAKDLDNDSKKNLDLIAKGNTSLFTYNLVLEDIYDFKTEDGARLVGANFTITKVSSQGPIFAFGKP